MAETVYASFPTAQQSEQAAGALLDYGVRKEDISLVAHESARTNDSTAVVDGQPVTATTTARDVEYVETSRPVVVPSGVVASQTPGGSFASALVDERDIETYRTGESELDADIEGSSKQGISVTTPADAAAGAAKGAGWGLGLGILAGAAMLMVPGIGWVTGGGALATAIAAALGTTVAGGVAGGTVGYLKDQGMPEHVAAEYDKNINAGGAMLAVSAPSNDVDAVTIQQVLQKYGAVHVNAY